MIPILVNKTHPLPENYLDGVELIETVNCRGKKAFVEKETFAAYKKLRDALSEQGVYISFGSNFRTIEEQKDVIRRLTEKYGEAYAMKTAAPPGTSEHHTGMALDLSPKVDGEWVTENMALMKPVEIWEKVHAALPAFGFILRYPKGKEEITGYGYEPWHIRYVGKELAEKVAASGLCLEEYINMKTVKVAAAVIRDGSRIFTSTRGYGDYKGRWEFPGGKIEPGETPEEALRREIQEEFDTEIAVGEAIGTVEYDYPAFHLSMDCFFCTVVRGNLTLLEAGDSRWLTREELDTVDWLPADRELIPAIRSAL